MSRRLLWVSLPDQRARRELYWMSRMPQTQVTALAAQQPIGDIEWVRSTYRRPVKRFVEAGALAWVRGLGDQDPAAYDWVTSLELCSLVTGQAARWRSRGTRRPLQAVITWENLPDQPLYKIPPYRQAVHASRGADLLLCMVDAARDHLLENGFHEDRIQVVKPGVDTTLFAPAPQPAVEPVVVFTSPLAENKGIDRVLDAMALVRRTVPEARLVVAGNGPLRERIEQEARDHPGQVELRGSLDAAGVAELLRSAAVFCTAPRATWKWTEQLGLAYLEAQSCGLPVVTTRCGTNDEAVQPPNLLVDDDVDELAQGLLHFLTDLPRAREVGAANRARMLAEHDLPTQCARMGEAFASVEAQHR
ncbi:glycosyltransferase family 4 protein [Allobranchiibius sp. GilTou73]|uniref:glycosyltransferase family 4 protein n=1 Tax=Allobranchiibius sp. GilTou73 TaxID=2904523 RepID=UPI001F1B4EEC|nr:glycosyltransferase family 4 protein [Allobranchiibius sp. GilTou73]UIJ33826.1 glycosyltransferase family 4 protein [Allobranchiibius sp. GilTou73]